MGLTSRSTGAEVLSRGLDIRKNTDEKLIALAGNPNVGKSTVFNSLTGLNQHTGNWPGKTVASAYGRYRHGSGSYILADIPGTYSLMASSVEEEIARDFICFGEPDAVVVVADAVCLERSLNLVLQTLEITGRAVVCVNLMDEAAKKKIHIDIKKLQSLLGVPVVGTAARSGRGLDLLMDAVSSVNAGAAPMTIRYGEEIERAIRLAEPEIKEAVKGRINSRWLAVRLIDEDESLLRAVEKYLGFDIMAVEAVAQRVGEARRLLEESGIPAKKIRDLIVSGIIHICEELSARTVTAERKDYAARDRKLDKILTSRLTGIPIMLLLLLGAFWLTITGANYPSRLLSSAFFWLEERLSILFNEISAPVWLNELIVSGVYRTLAWVVSVMLPPMAIFFPLFTLLEDSGYLPRIAFNLDNFFRKACAHGKQALTM